MICPTCGKAELSGYGHVIVDIELDDMEITGSWKDAERFDGLTLYGYQCESCGDSWEKKDFEREYKILINSLVK